MLKRRDILVGECYVNESARTALEVLEEIDRHRVKYNAYDLTSGNLLRAPHRICPKRQMIHWTDREATDEEKMNLNGAEVLEAVGRQAIGRL